MAAPVPEQRVAAAGHLPPLNVSVKLSALYSQIHPTDPDTAIEKISARLRPILRRAAEWAPSSTWTWRATR